MEGGATTTNSSVASPAFAAVSCRFLAGASTSTLRARALIVLASRLIAPPPLEWRSSVPWTTINGSVRTVVIRCVERAPISNEAARTFGPRVVYVRYRNVSDGL